MSAATAATPLPARASASSRRYIAWPAYDWAFFILSPVLALAIAEAIAGLAFPFERTRFMGGEDKRIAFFGSLWTHAHLFAVVFRSHLNQEIFRKHRVRFTLVPLAVFLGIWVSEWALVSALLLAAVWDVYHSSMQNFGLCRIYDAKAGNPPSRGRTLDIWINHCIYIGPVLGGLSLLTTLDGMGGYQRLGWDAPARALAWIAAHQSEIRMGVMAIGGAYVAFYVAAWIRLVRAGHRLPIQKVALLVSVAVASIWAWGFLPPLEAFFVSNLFHGAQYFAIVWWFERGTLRKTLRLDNGPIAALLVFAVFVSIVGAAALFYEASLFNNVRWMLSAALVISLMHFWYDSFIWSVRRSEV
jgi:hypothetical protein